MGDPYANITGLVSFHLNFFNVPQETEFLHENLFTKFDMAHLFWSNLSDQFKKRN
jgi:hypothetical protein